MPTEIATFQITSKLPGYLFVFAGITNIGDKIFLNCSSDCFNFTASMLNEIGIEVTTLYTLDSMVQCLFMPDSSRNLKRLGTLSAKTGCAVIYIKEAISNSNTLANASEFVSCHPNCIIVADETMDVFRKNFYVLISLNNVLFNKIEKHILRFGNQ